MIFAIILLNGFKSWKLSLLWKISNACDHDSIWGKLILPSPGNHWQVEIRCEGSGRFCNKIFTRRYTFRLNRSYCTLDFCNSHVDNCRYKTGNCLYRDDEEFAKLRYSWASGKRRDKHFADEPRMNWSGETHCRRMVILAEFSPHSLPQFSQHISPFCDQARGGGVHILLPNMRFLCKLLPVNYSAQIWRSTFASWEFCCVVMVRELW